MLGLNVLAGILILILGLGFHWAGQLFSVLRWERAERLGLQEKALRPEYKVYEHAIASADAALGWVYGVAGVGLILNLGWAYKLVWVPGAVFVYHALSFWVWTGNQRKAGDFYTSNTFRIVWTLTNLAIGGLAIWVGWHGC